MRATLKSLLFALVGVVLWFGANEAVRPGYTFDFWINIDELANVVLWGENETISARLGRWEIEGWTLAAGFCDVLDFFFEEEDHCINALRRSPSGS